MHRNDDDLRRRAVGGAASGDKLEGLLEGLGHHAVDGTDPDSHPGDRPTRGAALDRLEHALAVAQLMHARSAYIDRMRR